MDEARAVVELERGVPYARRCGVPELVEDGVDQRFVLGGFVVVRLVANQHGFQRDLLCNGAAHFIPAEFYAMYVPPVLEALGLVELEHQPKNNRIRAK
jgi:hypothetical protein